MCAKRYFDPIYTAILEKFYYEDMLYLIFINSITIFKFIFVFMIMHFILFISEKHQHLTLH